MGTNAELRSVGRAQQTCLNVVLPGRPQGTV